MGLVDQIRKASRASDIEKLLEEGKKFDMVSPKTKRRWSYVAKRRQAEWEAAAKAPEKKVELSAPKTEEAPVKKKKPYQKAKKS